MTRAAVTVFIETDHEGDSIDSAFLFRMALRKAVGDTLGIHPPRWDKPITITIHDAMETGIAAGNGYLWLEPTSKAFPRKDSEVEG
ncbi:hypothetical protein PP635_gp88 [Arthrobacter phage Auxilium]|uniref:Uncharacterized protein n=1 Tax=Arthrobacter phage Auxilium TaxID=2419948 RepID=A0A3G2KA45_9CAUD|nr:hypothetical protein PP635_gp88 [Arthrobacter phage Auxilium]AYN55863.1 hypothetical protein PBI_AUXILIUM_88 [Arthrobacter phage Auxilium]